jgi:hypothetical protein
MPLEFLRPLFKWCDTTAVGEFMRSGTWQFPLVETIHILALALLIGVVVVIDLRLMGLLMRGWTVAALTRELSPYLNGSLATILVSGVLLYLSEALKTFDNPAFWIKIYALLGAIVFHYAVVRRVAKADQVSPRIGWTVGVVSLVLWLTIGWAGRAIAFV